MAAFIFAGAQSEAVDIDPNGRISNFSINFSQAEYPTSPQDQAFYCAVVENFNRLLWQTTNGQHWIGEVNFTSGDFSSDVDWYRVDGRAFTSSLGAWAWGGHITMYDEVQDGFVQPASKLGWILLHEFGHFFYSVEDEYEDYNCPQWLSSIGICVSYAYQLCLDSPPPPPPGASCEMAKRYTSRWCDTTNHLEVNPDFPGLENPTAPGYTCWNRAKQSQVDLTHTEGVYIDAGDPPETVACSFVGTAFVNDALLALDRSGSMAYQGLSGVEAIRLASDAALLFYNKTSPGDYSGVVGFNDTIMNPWPIPYGPFTSEVTQLNIQATGNTNIALAIDTAADAIRTQGNGGNRKILVITDGKHNTGTRNPVEAAADAHADDIAVYTLAFGDADRDELRDIAEAGGGTFAVTGAESPNPDTPNPHELKQDIARSRFKLEGELEVFDRIGPVPSGTVQSGTFVVPTGTPQLDFSWLGDRTSGIVGACNFGLLHLELESPSGVIFLPANVDATVDGEYRTVQVLNPQPGTWATRVGNSAVSCTPGVAWTGFIRHPGLDAHVWVDTPLVPPSHPVVIHAEMFNGSVVTNISVTGKVRHLGTEWSVSMNDDGLAGDTKADDGIYTGTFNGPVTSAMRNGAYQIKVTLEADAAVAIPADVGILPDDADHIAWTPPPPRTAKLQAEGAFRVSNRYSLDPQGQIVTGSLTANFGGLSPGKCYSGLALGVVGLPMVPGRVRVGLDEGVQVSNLQVVDTYPADGGTVAFDACVDAGATPGPRTARVQVGSEIVSRPFVIANGFPTLDIPLVATGAGLKGTNWISLPNSTNVKTAEQLCAAIGPNATSVSQLFPDVNRRYTWSCAGGAGACTTSNPLGSIPEPGCSASACFCIDDGEGYEVKVSADSKIHVEGCESPVSITLPPGSATTGGRSYLASVPFATGLVTYNDLALAAGLPSTGLVRGIVTGLDPVTGTSFTCQAGSAACTTAALVPGRAYRLGYTVNSPAPYANPTTNPGPCADFDVNLIAAGAGTIGTNWISLPASTPIKTAEDLCAAIGPTAVSVAQLFPDVKRRYTWTCAAGASFCTTTNPDGALREPGCTNSSCFCIDDGEGYEIKVSADTSLHIAGCESRVPITLPPGSAAPGGRSYLASVPFATGLVTYNDLALAAGLPSTGLVRGTVTGIDSVTGTTFTCQAGSAACMTTALAPGKAYRLTYTVDAPAPYTNPTSRTVSCSTCGNAMIEAFDEQCDDGNLVDGDCCSMACQSACGCGQVCSAAGTECLAVPVAVAGVADDVKVTGLNQATGDIAVTFGAACEATGYTIYWGNLQHPWNSTYTGQACTIGCSGLATFSPGPGSIFFYIVPNDGFKEGSYGLDSNGVEVPEAVGLPACDYVQDLSNICR